MEGYSYPVLNGQFLITRSSACIDPIQAVMDYSVMSLRPRTAGYIPALFCCSQNVIPALTIRLYHDQSSETRGRWCRLLSLLGTSSFHS